MPAATPEHGLPNLKQAAADGDDPVLGGVLRLAPDLATLAHLGSTSAETRDRTGVLQIFGLTLSQLSYRGLDAVAK